MRLLIEKPKGRGACPSFFFAQCREASLGGAGGYRNAGHSLASTIAQLPPDWIEEDQWVPELEKLQALIEAGSDEEIIAWFKRWVPRCMALVPARRYDSFLRGVYACVIDEENSVDVF
jgi:hypothetical protein